MSAGTDARLELREAARNDRDVSEISARPGSGTHSFRCAEARFVSRRGVREYGRFFVGLFDIAPERHALATDLPYESSLKRKHMRTKLQVLMTKPLSALHTGLYRICGVVSNPSQTQIQSILFLGGFLVLYFGFSHDALATGFGQMTVYDFDEEPPANNVATLMVLRYIKGSINSFGAVASLVLGGVAIVFAALRRWKTSLAFLVLASAIFLLWYKIHYFKLQSLAVDSNIN